jgi:hypothetical protein
MSTPNQYPKTNSGKLNTPSSSTAMRDNNSADGVSLSFFFFFFFGEINTIV